MAFNVLPEEEAPICKTTERPEIMTQGMAKASPQDMKILLKCCSKMCATSNGKQQGGKRNHPVSLQLRPRNIGVPRKYGDRTAC